MGKKLNKAEYLMAMFEQQQRTSKLMFEADFLKNQGDLNKSAEKYSELISSLDLQHKTATTHNRQYPDSPVDVMPIVSQKINAMLTLSDVYEALGIREEAEKLRNKAMSFSKSNLPEVEAAERERQRAQPLIAQGRFNEALVSLYKARDLFQANDDRLKMASVTADIAGILEWLGDFERALREVDRAFSYIGNIEGSSDPSMADVLGLLVRGQFGRAEEQANLFRIVLELEQIRARINKFLGNYDAAEGQFHQILNKVPGIGKLGIEYQIASIKVLSGRYEEGLAHLEMLEPQFEGLIRQKLGVLFKLKGEALSGLGKRAEALLQFEAAIEELSRYRDTDSLWKARWARAKTLSSLGRAKEALSEYSIVVDTINDLRKAPLGYRLDSTYLKDKMAVFEEAIELSCDLGEAEQCCRFIEMIKSRILTATLSLSHEGVEEQAADLHNQVDNLSHQIDALEYIEFRDGWNQQLEEKRNGLILERQELLEQIRVSDPRWRSLSQPIPFDLQGVLKELADRHQAALTLFQAKSQVICVLLQDRVCTAAKVRLSADISNGLASYEQNLQKGSPNLKLFDASVSLNIMITDLIHPKLTEKAKKSKTIVISPNGMLHLLPWAGMKLNGKRMFEYCSVGILPNLSSILNLKTDFPKSPGVALIGDPDYSSLPKLAELSLATNEIENIKSIYETEGGVVGRPFLKENASESNFWRLAKHKKSTGNILHVTCHGTFDFVDPMNSALLLTDGKIDASEIARFRIEYNEVILSACSTGHRPTEVQGIPISGDDILGLPGAFLECGARSVLVSIPVARENVALDFMTIYHENRAEGKSPLDALRETQIKMLNDATHEPYSWVGFTVYGSQ